MNRSSKGSRIISVITFIVVIQMIFFTMATDTSAATKSSKHRVKYVAHRGLSARAPENTLKAFSLAAGKKDFYGVEFDVWESRAEKKDPLLLVMHDPNTKRMCGKDRKIRSLKRADLNGFRIVAGNNVKKYGKQTIPTVDQALDTIWRDSKGAIPVIELKHRLSKRGLNHLFDKIGNHKVVIISFEYKALYDAVKKARKRGVSKNITTMYLAKKLPGRKYKSTIRKLKKGGIDCISIKYRYVEKRTVRVFHKSGIKVGAWTLPNKKTAKRYIRMGVDYITSNGVVW